MTNTHDAFREINRKLWLDDCAAEAYHESEVRAMLARCRVRAAESSARAVEEGATWQQVGDALGISRQAAEQRVRAARDRGVLLAR